MVVWKPDARSGGVIPPSQRFVVTSVAGRAQAAPSPVGTAGADGECSIGERAGVGIVIIARPFLLDR